jgi:hypothetical protein
MLRSPACANAFVLGAIDVATIAFRPHGVTTLAIGHDCIATVGVTTPRGA